MPYIIPSSAITPGTVYQPGKGVPAYITANARALACVKGGALSSTHMLDQSPLNNGTRRTGEEGRCYTADGTDDEVNYGDIGSAIWFSGWVKLNSDDQCLFSLSNDTNTNLIVSSGVLTAGATLTLSAIKVDNVTKTASEAGALLNDNLWHFLSCGIGDGLGGASTADDVRFFTDGTNHGSVSGFDWRFWATAPTSDELTEAYSGEATNRNSASLSKYALWSKMDEQSGITSYDSSGNDLTGTITNATLATFHATQDIWSFQNQVGYNLSGAVYIPRDESDLTNGVLGNPLTYTGRRPNDFKLTGSNCLDLNGTNQAVRVSDDPAFDFTTALSGGAWVKNNSASLSSVQWILCKYDFTENKREFGFRYDSTNKLSLYVGFGNGAFVSGETSNSAIITNNWNHIFFTYSAGTVKLYVNGQKVDSTTGANPHPATLVNADADLTIGSILSSGSISSPWDGQLFDARIYSRVLSESEIQSIYEDFRNLTDDPNLVGRWKSQEGAGSVVYDSSGNDNHGTIQNAASNWGVTQDLVHSNLLEGHSIYEHASSDPIRVPFGADGQPLSITAPSGYSKTSDNYAGDYHNDAETTVDFDPDSTPEMGAVQLNPNVYQTAQQVFTAAQAADIVELRFKFRSTQASSFVVFNDGSFDPWLIVPHSGSSNTQIFRDSGSPVLSIDGSSEWGTTRDDLYNALCDGTPHNLIVSNLDMTFSVQWAANGVYVNGYVSFNWDSSTYLWDLQAFDSNGDPIIPASTIHSDPYIPPSALAFGDAMESRPILKQGFSRITDKRMDRFIITPDANFGDALSTIQKYTQS